MKSKVYKLKTDIFFERYPRKKGDFCKRDIKERRQLTDGDWSNKGCIARAPWLYPRKDTIFHWSCETYTVYIKTRSV